MIGITVGMIVVAGASLMMTKQVDEHRRLVQETQVQQDLRAAADLMLRDLRRAGFWATPESGVWAPGATMPASSPYSDTTPAVDTQAGDVLRYSYSRADNYVLPLTTPPGDAEDNVVTERESFGFRIDNGVLQSLLGGNWQPLTDRETLTITRFNVKLTVQPLFLDGFCSVPCPDPAACPLQQIRYFDITLSGHPRRDDKALRTVRVTSRMRNDRIVGSCPA
ncbi:hypothetical protein QWJ38_09740 [Pelomonas sp. PFR6]|uniref:Type IV pilus assembly protein PilW n=2 Tax=Roseateles violae TaxID=3058042 RepID=A0ABT8DR89_9BURK|nr:hypothetical protein [Pelomonas sp. PFR6]MDN3920558.1 hypothetical protein [Pelomonas sp. PFR6]